MCDAVGDSCGVSSPKMEGERKKPMDLNPAGLLIAAVAFAIAFGVAKLITRGKRRRESERQRQVERKPESRQVRRTRERRTGR